MANPKKTVRLVNDEGDVYEELALEYKPLRLRRQEAREIRSESNMMNFAEFDFSDATEENVSKVLKGYNTKEWAVATEHAKEKMVLVLWGLMSIPEEQRKQIVEEDYIELEKIARPVLVSSGLIQEPKKKEKQNG